MFAFFVVLLIGIVAGLARGGSFAALNRARLAWMPLLFGAFALQFVAQLIPERLSVVAFALVLASFAGILAWAAGNRTASGMLFIALGAAMNLTVIAANGGMPISADAAARAGYVGEDAERLVVRGKHFIDSSGDARLRVLSDWIPLGGNPSAASIGDLVLWSGLILLIQDLMRGPRGRRSRSEHAAETPHAPRERRLDTHDSAV